MKTHRGWTMSLMFLALLLSAATSLSAQGVNKMTMTTLRNGSASKNWSTDTTSGQLFGSSVAQVVGYYPTGRTDYPYQRMVIKISNFTGKGTYTDGQLSASYFEDLFSSGIVPTSFKNGTVVVTAYTANPFSIEATFNMSLTSNAPPPASSFSTAILNGVVKVNSINNLVVTAEAAASNQAKPVKAVQGDKVKWTLYVKDKDDNPISGADIYESNQILASTDKLVGSTNDSGSYTYQFKVPDDYESGTFPVRFVAKKDKFVDSDPFKVMVKIDTKRYYYYKCAGLPIYIFDAGEGKVWKGKEGETTISSTSTVVINSFLYFDGSVVIDTADGKETFSGTGRLYVPNVQLPNSGGAKDYTLFQGQTPVLSLSCTALFDKGLENISSWLSKAMDVDLKITKMRFTNQDEVATGITLEGKMSAGEKQLGQCNEKEAQYGVTLDGGMTLTTAGLQDLKFAIKDFGMGPGACLKNCGFTYTSNPVETFVFSGDYTSKAFGGIACDLTWKNKFQQDPITFGIKVTKTLATCKPIPDTPLCLKSVSFNGSCSDKLQLIKFGVDATVVSDEQLLKDKFNFNIPVIEQLAEIVGSGTYEAPFKVTLSGTANLFKVPSIGGTKRPWQITGTNSITLDVSSNTLTIAGKATIGHLGGTASFLSTDENTTLNWTSGLDITDQSSGSMSLPDLSDDLKKKPFVKNILKYLPTLPAELGSAAYRLHNTNLRANIDLSKNSIPQIKALGSAHLIVNLAPSSFWDAFDFGKGSVPLVQIIHPKGGGPDIQSIAEGTQPAKAVQYFDADATMQKVICFISSTGTVPASSLKSPNGTSYTGTSTDSSVVMYGSDDNSQTMWVVNNPAVGRWAINITNPTVNDSVDIFSDEAPNPFAISASTTGRTLNVTWDGSKEDATSMVEIYLDAQDHGTKGLYFGQVPAKDGHFSRTLSDSLTLCSYYVYGTVIRPNDFVTSYASGSISTGKTILAAPQNIVANSDQFGNTILSWTRSGDPATAGYFIYLRDQNGVDSLITSYASDITSASFQIDNPEGKSIVMQSFDETGFKGCPASAMAITVDVQDNFFAPADNRISLIPNPSNTQTTIRLNDASESPARVDIVDMLGQTIASYSMHGQRGSAQEITVDCSSIATGSYLVLVHNAQQRFSTIMKVVH